MSGICNLWIGKQNRKKPEYSFELKKIPSAKNARFGFCDYEIFFCSSRRYKGIGRMVGVSRKPEPEATFLVILPTTFFFFDLRLTCMSSPSMQSHSPLYVYRNMDDKMLLVRREMSFMHWPSPEIHKTEIERRARARPTYSISEQ